MCESKMWTIFLFGLVVRIGMISSQRLSPSVLGSSIDLYDPFVLSDSTIRVIQNSIFNERIFLDKAKKIFKNDLVKGSDDVELLEVTSSRILEPCKDLEQLLRAYFRDIRVDGACSSLDFFVRHWSEEKDSEGDKNLAEAISKRFKLPLQYLLNNYSYILIKSSLTVHEENISTPLSALDFKDDVQRAIDDIYNRDPKSLVNFFKNYGSHFISSYATGGSLYQVFVYSAEDFQTLQDVFSSRLKLENGIEGLTESQRNYLSPNFAIYIGNISSADSNKAIDSWARRSCTKITQTPDQHKYPNLLELHDNSTVLSEYQSIVQDKVVVSLTMISIGHVVKDDDKRAWFNEFLETVLGSRTCAR